MGLATEQITMTLMSMALDAASLRQQVGAHNIANANTAAPVGRVVFEERMTAVRGQLAAGLPVAPQHLDGLRARVVWGGEANKGVAGLDQEAARLSQNAVHYQALVRTLNGYMDLRSSAINDGKR